MKPLDGTVINLADSLMLYILFVYKDAEEFVEMVLWQDVEDKLRDEYDIARH